MADLFNSFISKSFLSSVWALEYEAFKDSADEAALIERLRTWADRKDLKETSAESAFIEEFFRETWGYTQSGQVCRFQRLSTEANCRFPSTAYPSSTTFLLEMKKAS